MEDFCHSFEHTIELQLIFLQHALGADVRILPILCGPFARSLARGGKPEDDDKAKAFLEALGEMREREGDKLFWILGVDMAHMGARYQDRFAARAGEGPMAAVDERDRRRIARINASDADGFWNLVQENRDDLKWCGSSPFYTFLKTRSRCARRIAALRAVEYRRQQRRQLRRNVVYQPGRTEIESYSMVASTSPAVTVAPTLAERLAIFPARAAFISFCIFMASTTTIP